MICPRCGEETGPGKKCERCGEALPSQKDMEVEYKEFKVSELLDIRMLKKTGVRNGEKKGEKSDILSIGEMNSPKESGHPDEPAKKTVLTVIMIVLIIVLAAITAFHFFAYSSGF